MQTDYKKHETPTDANNVLAAVLIRENETVEKANQECDLCGGQVDKYDKFTEEEHCQNCGWS
jgi:tRNA U54 and U55 pseudouridine synthase Pus10